MEGNLDIFQQPCGLETEAVPQHPETQSLEQEQKADRAFYPEVSESVAERVEK